jgi:hypothetical protein
MNPKAHYDEMIKAITDMEIRTAARTLSFHVGEASAITLEALAWAVFGQAGETEKRKTREILETLIEEHGFPVCSHSGKAGRWLAATKEEAAAAAAEREARAEKLLLSARKLRAARLPAGLPAIDSSKQMGLGL